MTAKQTFRIIGFLLLSVYLYHVQQRKRKRNETTKFIWNNTPDIMKRNKIYIVAIMLTIAAATKAQAVFTQSKAIDTAIQNNTELKKKVEHKYKQIEVANKQLQQAKQNHKQQASAYRSGVITMTDRLQADALYEKSRTSYIDACIIYILAITDYMNVTGR